MHPSFRAAAASLGLAAVTSIAAPAAVAHDSLVSSSPSPGAKLTSAPKQVDLTFNGPILAVGNRIAVTGPLGEPRTSTPTVAGTKISVPFTAEGDGTYEVSWRAVSRDGHPVSGTFSFTLGASKDGTDAGLGKFAATGGAGAASATTVAGPTTPTTNEPGDNHPGLIFGAGGVALAAILGGGALARRRIADDPR